ncbi:DMT family transporter [Floridanema evergladense]|uniref:DMT family transporter n=1 Tax=Floridaenema evergladense BLCC-F167 TaxID=3153639 RepID=A0ABV4WIP6_9CYAN
MQETLKLLRLSKFTYSQSMQYTRKIPGQLYLLIAVIMFAASNSIVRKLTDIGAQHLVEGRNPISLCNVLFVSNLCALLVLIPGFYREFNWQKLRKISRQEWFFLLIVAILSGALAPAFIFTALSKTMVSNVIIIGRVEPPLILALSVLILGDRINRLEIIGTFISLVGVVLTFSLSGVQNNYLLSGFMGLGTGEILTLLAVVAGVIATIITKAKLKHISLGIYINFRLLVGTIVFFILANVLYGSHHFAEAFSPFLWQWMLLYGILIVAVGQFFLFKGLKSITISEASLVNSVSPIAGIVAATLILGEKLTIAHYIGGIVIIAGLLLTQIGIWKKTSPQKRVSKPDSMQEMDAKIGFKGI